MGDVKKSKCKTRDRLRQEKSRKPVGSNQKESAKANPEELGFLRRRKQEGEEKKHLKQQKKKKIQHFG